VPQRGPEVRRTLEPSGALPSTASFVRPHSAPTLTRSHSQYQLALHQIDSMRKDGKFVGADGSIPEGQAIVVSQLSECHELVEMVRACACRLRGCPLKCPRS
jgi:hypothetical protein